MPAITLKNIPDDLYERIRFSAQANYRSIAGEILYRLSTSLGSCPSGRHELLERLAAARSRRKLPALTQELLDQARTQGRS